MRKLVMLIGLLALTGSCDDHNEIFSAEPKIEFEAIEFQDLAHYSVGDYLILRFNVTDGDGDFGLDNSTQHLEFPYQLSYYYDRNNGTQVPSDKLARGEVELESLINYADRLTPPYDTIPEIYCSYDRYYLNDFDYVDLYSTLNENYKNIFIEFLYQNPDGSYSTFDFYEEYCVTFDARVPSFSSWPQHQKMITGPFEVTRMTSKKAQITYTMTSGGFRALFNSKKMKLRFYVKDRALKESNIIETREFLLDEI
jgi:hypothetical protein